VPFVDLAAVGSAHHPFLPVRSLLRDRYPVAQQVAEVAVPTTVVHGSSDTVVPPAQSRQVAAAAAQLHRLVEVPGADHDDGLLLDGDLLVRAVVELAELTAGR
jgi:pimeloyl-ACP methyl ester carboxylesterase